MSPTTKSLLITSVFAMAALLTAPSAAADFYVTERAEGEALGQRSSNAATDGVSFKTEALETPGFMFFIPYFAVDVDDANSTTTLLSVRNESPVDHTVQVSYYPTDSNVPYVSRFIELQPKQTYTANLRDQLSGEPGVPADFVDGWVQISAGAAVSVDHFVVTPDDAFATGDTAIDLEELCTGYKVRYLVGGGFSGGTQITLFVPSPQGIGTDDPPSAAVDVYDEAGNLLESYFFYTDEISNLVSADNFTVPGEPFGTMEISFLDEDGGYAGVSHDASGLYSVGLKGYCLEFATAPAEARNPAN